MKQTPLPSEPILWLILASLVSSIAGIKLLHSCSVKKDKEIFCSQITFLSAMTYLLSVLVYLFDRFHPKEDKGESYYQYTHENGLYVHGYRKGNRALMEVNFDCKKVWARVCSTKWGRANRYETRAFYLVYGITIREMMAIVQSGQPEIKIDWKLCLNAGK